MVIRHWIRQASTLSNTRSSIAKSTATSSPPRLRLSRSEIVSSALCDDVLHRLRPTLPAPDTCDLIDVNPGRGIWSRKIHDILRPQRHVLVEPDLAAYSDHLTPLLDGDSSRYRYTGLLEDVFKPQNELLSERCARQDTPLGTALPHNPSLLMTVNLSGALLRTGNYAGAPSRKFFDDLYLSLWGLRSNIHRYGLIRVLAWVPDDEKDAYVPRTVAARRKQAVMLEASSTVREIASASTNARPSLFRRWHGIDVEDVARVATKEDAAGIKTPASRRAESPAPDLLSIEPTAQSLRKASFTSDAEWVLRFLELDDRLRKEHSLWYKKHAFGRFRGLHLKNPEQKAWRELLKRAQTEHNTHMKAVDLVKQERAVESSWKERILTAKNNHLRPAEEKRMKKLADTIQTQVNKLSRTNRAFGEKAIDDYRALDMSPPVMAWNQRDTEPLMVHAGEFQPADRRLALLDVVPRPEFLSKVDTHDQMVCFGHVVKLFCLHFSRSVDESLKMLVHEGVDVFVKTVPGIHNPTKGGWHDLSALRARSLPADMFVEIALAYERWPFRKSTESILMLGQDPQAAYRLADDE